MKTLEKNLYEAKLMIQKMDEENDRMSGIYIERENRAKERMLAQVKAQEDKYVDLQMNMKHIQKEFKILKTAKETEAIPYLSTSSIALLPCGRT